jgi:sortase A
MFVIIFFPYGICIFKLTVLVLELNKYIIKKESVMKKIGVALIIIGIIIVMIPVVGRLLNSYRQNKLLEEFREQINSQIQDQEVDEEIKEVYDGLDDIFKSESSAETTQTQTQTQNTTTNITTSTTETKNEETQPTTVKETTKAYKPKVIGTLSISKLDIDVLVVEGVKDEDLKIGVGHFPGTAGIGEEGNCAIAGHRSYTFGKFFNRLNELKLGDKIEVSDGIKTFTYVTYKIHIVEPSETYVLNQVKDHRILTLVTCEPIYTATHRLIVHARIID